MAWPWRGVFGVPAPGVFPLGGSFLVLRLRAVEHFRFGAGARSGLNAADPAEAAGIGNLPYARVRA